MADPFCSLCGRTDLAGLGEHIGICLDATACHQRQYRRLRDRADEATARAEAAEAKVLEYENSITWHTSCTSCARTLDSAYAETVRRENAEARAAVLERHLPAVLRALEAAVSGAGYEAIARPYRDARDALSAGEEAGQ